MDAISLCLFFPSPTAWWLARSSGAREPFRAPSTWLLSTSPSNECCSSDERAIWCRRRRCRQGDKRASRVVGKLHVIELRDGKCLVSNLIAHPERRERQKRRQCSSCVLKTMFVLAPLAAPRTPSQNQKYLSSYLACPLGRRIGRQCLGSALLLVSHSNHAGSSGITIVWPALRRLRISAPTRRSRRLEERWISVRWAKQERLARRLSPLPKMFYAQAYASGLRFADKNLRHGLACSAPRAGQAEVAVAFFGRPADGS